MEKFKTYASLDDILSANNAECVDGFEGCLLDNYLAYSEELVIAILETYATPNSSCYTVYAAKIDTDGAREVEQVFYDKQEAYYKEYEREGA